MGTTYVRCDFSRTFRNKNEQEHPKGYVFLNFYTAFPLAQSVRSRYFRVTTRYSQSYLKTAKVVLRNIREHQKTLFGSKVQRMSVIVSYVKIKF